MPDVAHGLEPSVPAQVAESDRDALRRDVLVERAARVAALDGLRGFAVLLVFCVHAAGNAAAVLLGLEFEAGAPAQTAGEGVLFWLHRSHHGVFLFFVLSGFLIGRMWWPPVTMSYRPFVTRRLLRVYPAFLLAFVASLVFAYVSGTWQPPDAPRILANVVFLNGWPALGVAPFNLVTWSLFYELTFYLVFPALALGVRRLSAVGAWLLPLAGIVLPPLAVLAGADPIVLCYSLLFCGVLAACQARRVSALARAMPGSTIVVAYLAVTTLAVMTTVSPVLGILGFGMVAVLVLAKGQQPGNVIHHLLTMTPLVALGRVSYSFYLMHWMIVVLVARGVGAQAQNLGVTGGTFVIFAAGFLLSAVAATTLWWVAERPYFAWAQRK